MNTAETFTGSRRRSTAGAATVWAGHRDDWTPNRPCAVPSPLVSEIVRIIEYQVISPLESAELGLPVGEPNQDLRKFAQVGVLRCVNRRGEKLTLVGDGSYAQRLVDTGAAADPAGVRLPTSKFPITRDGWPGRLGMARTGPAARGSGAAPAVKERNQRRRSA